MKFFGFHLLALIIAVTSLVLNCHDIQPTFDYSSTIQLENVYERLPITTQLRRIKSVNQNYIAQKFVPFILFADFSEPIDNFTYYLPVRNFIREREYFLLI